MSKPSLLAVLAALLFALPGYAANPVLAHDLQTPARPLLETQARELMALSDQEVLDLIPTQTPFISSDCPNCGQRHFTRGLERSLWKFTPPGKLECVKCGAVVPSEKFPLNAKATYLNTLGEKVEIAFHQDAQGRRFALPGTLQSWQNGWLLTRLEAVAKLYQLTHEERYARRVALALEHYAQLFPHYVVKDFVTQTLHEPAIPQTQKSDYVYVSTGGPFMRDGRKYAERPPEPAASLEPTALPYGWTQSRWGWGRWGNDFPAELLRICDLTWASGEYDRLTQERKRDVRGAIVRDLFGNSVGFLQEYPFYYQLNNNASSHIAEIIRAGRVLGQPEWVHFGYRWSREVLERYAFCRDGAFAESPGYLYVFLATQEGNFKALEGYSDPAGFTGRDGLHLENLGSDGSLAFLQKARVATESIRFPNGSSLPLGDNRNDDYLEPLFRPGARSTPLARSIPALLPGYGHAVLGAGAGDRQVQAHLQFSGFTGAIHTHTDSLSLMLWAFGSELFTDIGYHKSKYRGYASTTLSHNTVVIDRTPQHGAEPKGSVLHYDPSVPGLTLLQVEARGAYENTASRYRRTLLLNARDAEAPYLIDVFEVRGGHLHDYALHGPTLFESDAEASLPLTPLPGERPLLTPDETWTDDTGKNPYGVFTKVSAATTAGDFAVTFRLRDPYALPAFQRNDRYHPDPSFHYEADPAAWRDHREIGVRSWFPGGPGERQVLLGRSPSLIRSGLSGGPLTEKLERPSLLLRRAGADGLASVFVAVHEPYYGQPKLRAVTCAEVKGGAGVCLQIASAEGADTFLLSWDGTPVQANGHSLEGHAALLSSAGGNTTGILFGGTSLQSGAFRLTAPVASYRGEVQAISSRWTGATENAFTTSTPLPAGEALRGRWLILSLGADQASEAFEIDRVESNATGSRILLKDDPSLRRKSETTEEIFFPRRSFRGPVTFTIQTCAVKP